MNRIRCFCPAKINLNLRVCGRREDGYHLLQSEVVPIDVGDSLEIGVGNGNEIYFSTRGRAVPAGSDNLVVRAAELYLTRRGVEAEVEIVLDKRLPHGAGLGGGSSDAASTLRGLDCLFGGDTPLDVLAQWALELGADVPFFVYGRPAQMTGVGDVLRPLESWIDAPLVVAFRGRGLSTPDVYKRYDASLTSQNSASKIPVFPQQDTSVFNDLEAAAIQIDPGVYTLKQDLLARGALEVGMSGSGSAVFGFFRDQHRARECAERMSEAGDWAVSTRILAGPPAMVKMENN